jgi:SAM-dependent methyltransferase
VCGEHPSEYQIQKFWSIFIKHDCNKVLDAGCGGGWLGKFKPARVRVYGIDSDPEKVKTANKYENSVVGDIRSLPYRDKSFDGIFCHHVLEHLEEPKKAVKEFFRVLRKDGIVIAEVPSKWDPNVCKDPTHKQFFTVESLSKIFKGSGFQILNAYYCALEIKIIKSKPLYEFLSFIGRSLAKKRKNMRRAIRIYAKKVKNSHWPRVENLSKNGRQHF